MDAASLADQAVDLISRNALASGFLCKKPQIQPGASVLRLIERLNQHPVTLRVLIKSKHCWQQQRRYSTLMILSPFRT